MEAYETRLEAARRRVAEQEKLVAVWRETISGLTQEGQSTELAEKMLQLMERTLARVRADLSRKLALKTSAQDAFNAYMTVQSA